MDHQSRMNPDGRVCVFAPPTFHLLKERIYFLLFYSNVKGGCESKPHFNYLVHIFSSSSSSFLLPEEVLRRKKKKTPHCLVSSILGRAVPQMMLSGAALSASGVAMVTHASGGIFCHVAIFIYHKSNHWLKELFNGCLFGFFLEKFGPIWDLNVLTHSVLTAGGALPPMP